LKHKLPNTINLLKSWPTSKLFWPSLIRTWKWAARKPQSLSTSKVKFAD